jgi:hypothetical protein
MGQAAWAMPYAGPRVRPTAAKVLSLLQEKETALNGAQGQDRRPERNDPRGMRESGLPGADTGSGGAGSGAPIRHGVNPAGSYRPVETASGSR